MCFVSSSLLFQGHNRILSRKNKQTTEHNDSTDWVISELLKNFEKTHMKTDHTKLNLIKAFYASQYIFYIEILSFSIP